MDRAAEVMARLNRDGGRSTGDAFKACNDGAHGDFDGELVPFVRDAEKLAQWLQKLA